MPQSGIKMGLSSPPFERTPEAKRPPPLTAPRSGTSIRRGMAPAIDRLLERVNADAALVRRGRFVNLTFLLGVGDHDYVVTIAQGRVVSVEPRRLATTTGRFTVRAAAPVWQEFWTAVPTRD